MPRSLKDIKAGIRRRLRKLSGRPPAKYDSFTAVQKHFFSPGAPLVIFDVGAHQGESVSRFKTVFPQAEIHSFEADVKNFERLKQNTALTPKVHANNFGVGSEHSRAVFYKNMKSDTSSFRPLNPGSNWLKVRSEQYKVTGKDFTQTATEIEIRPLDSYIAEQGIERINILKIDTQGYEDEVLKGAAKALKSGKIDMIETELIVGDVYDRALTFSDIESILLPCGYRFYAIDTGGDLLRHPSLAFNLIYIRESLLKPDTLKQAA